MDEAKRLLKQEFGLDAFRSHQADVIERLLVGNQSALAIMPTGSGKSLCYQIPALCLSGLTLVVSPLLALMKDQVDALIRKGVSAGRLDSSLSTEEYHDTIAKIRTSEIKLLYVAPERLNMEGFMEMIKAFQISLLAVDESHCVAEWGNAFRPDYLKISRFAKEYNVERVLCLTATATNAVASDICRSFEIDEKQAVFRAMTYRSNLKLDIIGIPSDPFGDERTDLVIENLRANPGASIVYITTQKNTERVAEFLAAADIPAKPYHAGLPDKIRKETQEWFMKEPNAVVCATIAFGMGIDKSNIRNVIHFNMPKTLEGYSQEVGRAGRDGLPGKCTFYFCPDDRRVIQSFARGNTPSRKSVYDWFHAVCDEAQTQGVIVGGVLVINRNEQQRLFDIRDVTLALLFAQLELNFHFLRAITPMNANHRFKATPLYQNTIGDDSPVAEVIRTRSLLKKLWYIIDVDDAATHSGIERGRIVAKLQEWDGSGWIDLDASQRRYRYLITKALPTDPTEIDEIAEKIFLQLEKREKDEVARMNRVVEWAKAEECLARGLAGYFGDSASFGKGAAKCSQCAVCTSGGPITLYDPAPAPFDQAAFDRILECTSVRDDARFLVRIAFGITSPRLTHNKLTTKNPVFGSMVDHDFDDLLARFQAVVDVAQSESQVTLQKSESQVSVASSTAPAPAQKRKAPAGKTSYAKKPRRA